MQILGPEDPRMIGEYTIVGRLGEGGMGRVYKGRSPGGRWVAVKVTRPELAADADFRSRFRSEIEAARRVGGFHTAQVVDADPDAALPWMVTAFVPGRSLHEVVADDGPMAQDALCSLGAALAEALRAIHACGLIHRDLKPSNIIMSEDGPRVLDFGIARALNQTRQTATNLVIGTPGFLAPEQIGNGVIGAQSDVFALGAVLVHASGGRAFGDGDPMALMYRAVHEEPDLSTIPAGLHALVASCLAKDPAARPTTARLLTELAPEGHRRQRPTAVLTRQDPVSAGTTSQPQPQPSAPDRIGPAEDRIPPTALLLGQSRKHRNRTLFWVTLLAVLNLAGLGYAWSSFGNHGAYAALPLLFLLPLIVSTLRSSSTAEMDRRGITVNRRTFTGKQWTETVPWHDVATVSVDTAQARLLMLSLGLTPGAPVPSRRLAHRTLQSSGLLISLPNEILRFEPASAMNNYPAANPRSVARLVLDTAQHYAPGTVLGLPGGDPRPAVSGNRTLSPAVFTTSGAARAARAVAYLLGAAVCGGGIYLTGPGADSQSPGGDLFFLVCLVLGAAGLGAAIRALIDGYTVTVDVSGICVDGMAQTGPGRQSLTLAWADILSVTRPEATATDAIGLSLLIHLRPGVPLPSKQKGVKPTAPDRVQVVVPCPLTLGAVPAIRDKIRHTVAHYAPEVRTTHL